MRLWLNSVTRGIDVGRKLGVGNNQVKWPGTVGCIGFKDVASFLLSSHKTWTIEYLAEMKLTKLKCLKVSSYFYYVFLVNFWSIIFSFFFIKGKRPHFSFIINFFLNNKNTQNVAPVAYVARCCSFLTHVRIPVGHACSTCFVELFPMHGMNCIALNVVT